MKNLIPLVFLISTIFACASDVKKVSSKAPYYEFYFSAYVTDNNIIDDHVTFEYDEDGNLKSVLHGNN
ncbi:MAG: hypothetical protein JW969_07775 [Spirochaetales bacterium]|nr:hypothetical protein [Spirochaetales bacterium]